MTGTAMQPELLDVAPSDGGVFTGLSGDVGFRNVLRQIENSAQSNNEKGAQFEKVVKAFIQQDKAQSERFADVWLWDEWPGRDGPDTGIDLVAQERDGGDIVGIQCKFYAPGTAVRQGDIDSFLAHLGRQPFRQGIIVSATENWGPNVQRRLRDRQEPVSAWGAWVFENSSIDWSRFDLATPAVMSRKPGKNLRDYQQDALDGVVAGFRESDRGKLIMPCGSGKTFTALRIAERMVGVGGSVLFLTPSLSLLSQSLVDWTNDAELPLQTLAVCSDATIKGNAGSEDISPCDLRDPATTDAEQLAARWSRSSVQQRMTVAFATYQSLDVVAEAQGKGMPEFDLVICDEAHRTTGVSLAGNAESNFRRVHDSDFIAARKRLYMTATPRVFSDTAKQKAAESALSASYASMDDERVYGPVFYRLGFGEAVDRGILSPYQIVIMEVDPEQVGADLDRLLSDANGAISMDNGGKMIGCWNGLGKRGIDVNTFADDPQPVKRAVAYSNRIGESKAFCESLPLVIAESQKAAGDVVRNELVCEVRHVDGRQSALQRAEHLAWLREEPAEGVCRVLTNARCLTEGIDVPALDAIMFLHPRKSDIDMVQAVGRVMRQSPGKKRGYIILPVVQAPGSNAGQTVSGSAYRYIWQVINAIAAHDDRFEAVINQLALATKAERDYPDYDTIGNDEEPERLSPEEEQIRQLVLISGSAELRDAILAQVVDKYADPRYWEKWAANLQDIARRHEGRVRALLQLSDAGVRPVFDDFLAGLCQNLNDGIGEDAAIGMLSQHLIIKPVFDALFEDYAFTAHNPVSLAMQGMLDALEQRGLEKETAGLEAFYRDVRVRAQGVRTAAGRQQIIAELYERFFKLAMPDIARSLGITYTPVEVVDWLIRSIEDALQREFRASMSDAGVHVLDPFTGTGAFIARLLQSGIIKTEDLVRKYAQELHANELNLLAYYIAAVNIEAAYHDVAKPDRYQPFPGIVLTDTFQAYEPRLPMDTALMPDNNARIARQKTLDIQVITGNPPWSATNNRPYPAIDERITKAYAEPSAARHVSALYDPYYKAIRLASDRVQSGDQGGIVAFVTNGGFIDSNAADGFRKALAAEFDAVYCYNLRGNAYLSGERWKMEGGKVFGGASRAGVALLLLVKRPAHSTPPPPEYGGGGTIHYCDIGDYLSRERKLGILADGRLSTAHWQIITPNAHGDWIDQRSAGYSSLIPLAGDGTSIFSLQTLGVVTSRDAWCFNQSSERLRANISRSMDYYNAQVDAFGKTVPSGSATERERQAKAFVAIDETKFHWDAKNYRHLANRRRYAVDDAGFTIGAYRPFFKQNLYFAPELNNSVRQFAELYPDCGSENLGICVTGTGTNVPFHILMTDHITEYCLTGVNSIYLPRYRYVSAQALTRQPDPDNPELERVSNISPDAVAMFRRHYVDDSISDDDLFYYVYGVLHSAQYLERYAADLRRSAARIPMASTRDDFRTFVAAGMELADLHVNYESVEPHPTVLEVHTPGWNPDAPDAYRVEKMKYAGGARNPDRTTIIYNAGITLTGIPEQALQYRLGSRSALDWLIDRYQVRTDSKSGIVNDPNDWATDHDYPRYIVDLVKRIATVSVRTVDIIAGLPELPA